MDIEKQVLELRTRINSLRAQLELNSTHDNSNTSSSEDKESFTHSTSSSEKPKREPTSSELLKAKLMGKRSSNSSNDSDSSTSS